MHVFLSPNTCNTKFTKAQLAQVTSNFKNIKQKILKTNAAILVQQNMQKPSTGVQIHKKIKANGNNRRSYDTINLAIKYRLSQELTFFYTKEKLCRTHLECAIQWNTLWNCIRTSIEYKLEYVNETLYGK